jgi:hypothetical protein
MPKSLHRVFAGNRGEFLEYCKIFEKNHNDARYISASHQLMGLPRGSTVFLVGTYRLNKAFREVYETLIVRDFRIVEVQF